MTSTLEGVRINRNLINALRCADSVTFHYYRGEGEIRAHLDDHGSALRIFSAAEQRMFPRTQDHSLSRMAVWPTSTVMFGYGDDFAGNGAWRRDMAPGAAAFHMLAGTHKPWQTIVSMLRVDDVLCLEWTADNNTDVIRDAGLHCDELRLTVTRKTGTLTFAVATSVGRDNTARMIRRHG